MSQELDLLNNAIETKDPKDVVLAFLANTGKENIRAAAEKLVHENATYVSLNFENKELEQIEPWCGTRQGRQIYINTFEKVETYWEVNDFQITDALANGETVAVFGKFTYTSVEVGHQFTSPFSVLAKVKDGLIHYFQFMEDTYASARSFRKQGQWEIQNNSKNFTVGD